MAEFGSKNDAKDQPAHESPPVIIQVDEGLFLKDPNSSQLGQNIIRKSIEMMRQVGLESFTFRKLALTIGTSEPSVYRYFESKHKLLLYLLSWYWNWMDYKVQLSTINIASPEEKLSAAVGMLSRPIEKDNNFRHIDEVALYRIVINESSKVYLLKANSQIDKADHLRGYRRICERVASFIYEINPGYRHPKALVSTVIETCHNQKFFAEHLPGLTDLSPDKPDEITSFLVDLVIKAVANTDGAGQISLS